MVVHTDILQPDVITKDVFAEGLEQVRKKKGDSPALSKLRLTHFEEGLCVQAMHIGPYATEPATIEQMRAFALEMATATALVQTASIMKFTLATRVKLNPRN